MYVWEMVSCRLRVHGWSVWHSAGHDAHGPTYTVHAQRPGVSYEASGSTLTDAYAVAARKAREFSGTTTAPHFIPNALSSRA